MNAMNRREFLGGGMAAGVLSTGSPLLPALSSSHSLSLDNGSRSTPKWLMNEALVTAGCWDEFPLFQRRLGGGPAWYEQIYAEERSGKTVRQLKEIGVTLAIIHYFKGFGLDAEREHIEQAHALSILLKENGIRVGLYVGSTIAYETFLVETPEAEEWIVPDYLGKPVFYADQTFRKRVYFMHPGYQEYMRKVVRLGIERFRPDLIHFDNTSNQARPAIFQHPMAIHDFRKYLISKYDTHELKDRFGFSNLSYVVPPKPDYTPETIDDPLFQEWTDFRCHQLDLYYSGMSSFIHSIDPAVALDNNPSSGLSGVNTIWNQGVHFPRVFQSVDIMCTEEGNNAGVSANGILISKIRTFKMASLLNKRIFCYTYGSLGAWGYEQRGGGPLQMAESMAYNRQCIGMIGGFHDAPELPQKEREYVRFFRDNFEFYRDSTSVSDVALLYNYSTMGFNNGRPWDSFMLASQMLIQCRLQFDIVFDEHLEDLSKYSVLFLADQECLNDRQVETIRNFVLRGGGLVATEQTSLYTEWRRRRQDFALKDFFGVTAPKWNGPGVPESILPGGPIQTRAGKGRVVYIPEIIPSTKRPVGEDMTNEYWSPAVNSASIRNAVLWAMGNQPVLKTAPGLSPYMTMELIQQNNHNRLVLHTLNYGHDRDADIQDIRVTIVIPGDRKVSRIRLFSPDVGYATQEVPWSGEQSVTFTIPAVSIYTITVLDLAINDQVNPIETR